MDTHISSWGKSRSEIERAAAALGREVRVWARFTLEAFQRLRDLYGHATIDLPGQICEALRASPGCACAEVLCTPNAADRVVVAGFTSEDLLGRAASELAQRQFQLAADLKLSCPPLAVVSGAIDTVLFNLDVAFHAEK